MAEPEKGDVGTTGDVSEGLSREGDGENRGAVSGDVAGGGSAVDDNETAESKGTIAVGGGDAELTQASGGSVD